MKLLQLAIIGIALLICSCSSDTINPNQSAPEINIPYLSADINDVPFCIYRDSIQHYESGEFTFGTSILSMNETGEAVDTSFTLRASYKEMHISLNFSYRDAINQQSIALYRNTSDITYHWGSAGLQSVDFIDGQQQGLMYTTHCHNAANRLSEPVGKVTISSFDAENKSIRGEFSFTAYGYKHEGGKVLETNEQLTVENGQFYVEWEKDLFMQ